MGDVVHANVLLEAVRGHAETEGVVLSHELGPGALHYARVQDEDMEGYPQVAELVNEVSDPLERALIAHHGPDSYLGC